MKCSFKPSTPPQKTVGEIMKDYFRNRNEELFRKYEEEDTDKDVAECCGTEDHDDEEEEQLEEHDIDDIGGDGDGDGGQVKSAGTVDGDGAGEGTTTLENKIIENEVYKKFQYM
jgi:hypothetical protein